MSLTAVKLNARPVFVSGLWRVRETVTSDGLYIEWPEGHSNEESALDAIELEEKILTERGID
jgi:hypothetical protein